MPDKVVEIPGVGNIAFPESMSDADIATAAAKIHTEKQGAFGLSAEGAGEKATVSAAEPNTLGTAASHFAATVNPVQAGQLLPFPKALGGSGLDNPLLPSNIVKAMSDVKKEGDAAWDKGDHMVAFEKYLESVLPVLGPMMSHGGNQLDKGEYAAFGGDLAGVLTNIVVPKVLANVAMPKVSIAIPAVAKNPNALETAAVDFGQQRGIPVDAGTATGSQFIKNVQKKAGSTWGGASTTETAQAAVDQALARVGDDLAGQTNAPQPGAAGPVVDPARAGSRVADALETRLKGFNQTASDAYDRLRQIAAKNVSTRSTQPGKPFQSMELPVDLRGFRQQVAPLYQQLKREAELVPLMGDKARALTALDRLMHGPNFSPLMTVDQALGDLKALARGKGDTLPELKTSGQASASQAVTALDAEVRKTAATAGPDAVQALQDGRAATRAKYDVADVRDLLSTNEPRRVFNELTAKKDVGVERLRAVAQYAPKELPHIGRAVVEDMLNQATAEGGFGHTDKLWADWQKLGPQTKQMLFGAQTGDLDKFFLLAKKLGENPNPSGTAQVLSATQVLVGIPGYALAKMLYSPTAVRALTKGLSLSVGPARFSPTARAMATANIAAAARVAGVPALIPAAAEQGPAATK